jgi:hypothetical protein
MHIIINLSQLGVDRWYLQLIASLAKRQIATSLESETDLSAVIEFNTNTQVHPVSRFIWSGYRNTSKYKGRGG